MPLSGGEPSPYFEWEYKGLNSASDTGWRPAPLLLEHLRNNHPDLKVLNLDGRGLGDEACVARAPLFRSMLAAALPATATEIHWRSAR